MAILAIVPGKPKMCLQENLADCADCGGLKIIYLKRNLYDLLEVYRIRLL